MSFFWPPFPPGQGDGRSPLQAQHDSLAQQVLFLHYSVGTGHGKCPSATMKIRIRPRRPCPGFASGGSIEISYDLPHGIQSPIHPHPGVPYNGTQRTTYLPNTSEGRQLLTRFRHAFLEGEMFQIGRSLTSGRDHQVTWSSIPNKTSLHGGQFGFPDPKYLQEANQALDRLSIPAADNCLTPNAIATSSRGEGIANPSNQQDDGQLFPVSPYELISYEAPVCLASPLDGVLKPIVLTHPRKRKASLIVDQPSSMSSSDEQTGTMLLASPPACAPSTNGQKPQPSSDFQPATIITADNLDGLPPLPPPNAATDHAKLPTSIATTKLAVAPTLTGNTEADDDIDECPICFGELAGDENAVEISTCGHKFHKTCILDAFKHNSKCPVCRQPVGEPHGKSPSGTMTIQLQAHQKCPGFALSSGVITICYNIPGGTQAQYHENPGQRYGRTSRLAYLPNCLEGRQLLYRLKYAWKHGLTFRVGTSLTTGLQNQVTWTSIHHKTSLHGGAHGFPDDNYLKNCNDSLDALHVPPAKDCQ